MAKNNNQQQNFSDEEKRSYYANRVNDSNLSEGQRKHAAKRLVSLCGNSGSKSSSGNLPASAGQTNAFNAGIGYGAAKAGKRVPIRDENKQSFRDGVQRGRRLK